MVYAFLADGFEMIEALTVVDILRRGKVDITTVSISDDCMVRSSHNVYVKADKIFNDCDFSDATCLFLPGGMPGTRNLDADKRLADLLVRHNKEGKLITAICAAPSVLGHNNILVDKNATCYPSFEGELTGATFLEERVVCDGNVITSRGMGTAIDFSLAIIEKMCGSEKAEEIAKSIIYI